MNARRVDQELACSLEVARLFALTAAQARAAFYDRVSRALLLDAGPAKDDALAFDAHLATALREQARLERQPSIWDFS